MERQYQAIVLGVPKRAEGVVETNIGRDVRNRKAMGTFPFMSSRCCSLLHHVAHCWPYALYVPLSTKEGRALGWLAMFGVVLCRG